MKIIFICSALEPGKDGVGDYTRRLAAEIIKRGYPAGIISLNDRFVNSDLDGEQTFGQVQIRVLRLAAIHSYEQRFAIANRWVEENNPEWLSLQFVPFGFNVKGLPFSLAKELARMGKGKKWHIMFHELWVGMDKESAFKFKVWGWLQKFIIKKIISKLRPMVVHTQTALYKRQLQQLGVAAVLLPLFSNIPVTNTPITATKNSGTLRLLVFGNIHYGAPVPAFAEEAAGWGMRNDTHIECIFIGRCGNELKHWRSVLNATGIITEIIGEATPEIISHQMHKADWGVVTTPISLVEKSGSYAAMREHRLPVLCVSRAWTPYSIGTLKIEGVYEYTPGKLADIFNYTSVPNPLSSYTVVNAAEQMLKSLF